MADGLRVFIISPYPLKMPGGITRHIQDISRALTSGGENVRVVERNHRSAQGKSRIPHDLVWSLLAFIRILVQRPDVVHAHAHWVTAVPGFILKLLGSSVTCVFTFHTNPVDGPSGMKRSLLSLVLSRCDYITFVSGSLRDAWNATHSLRPKQVIVHPCSRRFDVSEKETAQFRKEFDLEDDSFPLCFVGPLVWEKKAEGVRLLISCFKSVSEGKPELRLIIVGGGPYLSRLQQFAEEIGCAGKVRFTGMIKGVGVPLSISKVYVHISFQEALGHSILDAMAAGKPIVASDIGGIPEAIANGSEGLLVSNNEGEVAGALERMISEKDLRDRMGGNARKKAESQFSCQSTAGGYLEVYRGLSKHL
ncbi:MAG: glycosyltransferase family 4 protein [Thermoplasmata archaeon]|nr:glycosyltransferase family 4 protein [Thermoplasmata archaeon]